MASITFKIMAFAIFLNLAVGLFALIGSGGWSTNDFQYDRGFTDPLNDELSAELASPPVEGTTSVGEKILDFFTIGLYTKVKDFLYSTVFALSTFFLQAEIITEPIRLIFNGLLLTIYSVGMFELFTGKTIWGSK